ncbi:putative kinesin light protein [Seiridium cardinale]
MSTAPTPTAYKAPETNGGIVTSWAPVTTDFTAASECSSLQFANNPPVIAGWDPGYGVSFDSPYTCHPKAVTTWWLAALLGTNANTVFSLGPITCPPDYTTAGSSSKDATSTMVFCCPQDYDFVQFYAPGDTGECTSKLAAGQEVTYQVKIDGTWTANTTSMQKESSVVGIPINGWTFAATTSEATNTASCNAESRLGSGTAAGIGVGISLGVTGLATFAAGLFMLRKSRRINANHAPVVTDRFSKGTTVPPNQSHPSHATSPGQTTATGTDHGYPSYGDASQYHQAYSFPSQEVPARPLGELDTIGTHHSELEGEFEPNNKMAFPLDFVWPAHATNR